MDIAGFSASIPDLLRLVAVPIFAWAAVQDIRTRRVPSVTWIPLGLVGLLTLAWDGLVAYRAGGLEWTLEFLVPAAISLGFVVPLAYGFWWMGGFGGADAKALMVIALLFPTFPVYRLGSIVVPQATTPVGAFSFTVLTNAVVIGMVIPLVLAVRNGLAGRIAPVMFVGWPTDWRAIPETHGRLLQTTSGLSRRGLDLDALRMYLRWRNRSLSDLRADPSSLRDPESLPPSPYPPTDGAISATRGPQLERSLDVADTDEWGAQAFLEDIDHGAYGTDVDTLRDGLEVLSREETVWVSPGMPFLVPVFGGLLVGLLYGDVLVSLVL